MTDHRDAGDGSDTRRIGLALAAIAALVAIGVVIWAAVFRSPAASAPVAEIAPTPAIDPSVAELAPETTNLRDLLRDAEDAELQFFDPEDESLRMHMTFARLDPQPNGRFFAEEPEAWIFMRNGVSAQITAHETSFRVPASGGEPESGRFTGDVRIAMHRGRLESETSRRASVPVTTLTMDELHFDAALGQLRTTSDVDVQAVGLVGGFEGLELVIDEPAKRLSHLSTRGGGWLRQTDAPANASASDDQAGGGDDAATPAAGREDYYAATIDGGVRIDAGDRSIEADQIDIWAVLVDGALPPDAIGGFLASAAGPGSGSGADGDENADEPSPPATLRWAGRLVVEPRSERPAALGDDALAARLSAPSTGVVEMRDPGSGFAATAASAGYHATSRRFSLAGSGGSGVSVRVAGAGEAACGRFDIDLTTGIATMPGPGELRAEPDATDTRRTDRVIAWQRGATMVLATGDGHVDLSGDWPLESATFEGGVTAREGEAELAGETIVATFARSARTGEGELSRVVVEGDARALAPGQGRVLGERLTVEFTTRAADGALTPTSVRAEGRALAERGEEGIEAEVLVATLGRDPMSDELRIEHLDAQLGVLVRGEGGEEVLADSLDADPLRGVYDLVGEPVTLRRGTASVTGGSMRIDEIQERLTVFGPGELTYHEDRDIDAGYQNVTVAWAGTMTFDGVMERAEFVGDCVVVAEPDALTRDTLRGERIIVEVDLDDNAGSSADATSAFRRAQVIGEVEETGAGRTAQVESRRYRADPGSDSGVALEFLAFLDGPTLIADAATDSLMAPAAGRLLFEDRRADGEARDGVSTRGTTLFEWEGAARFDRGSGEAVMTRAVRLRQKPPGEDRVTELECERLDAAFAIPSGESSDRAALRAQLTRARASGAVYARQGGRELIADRLEFNAEAGVAQAWANEGNLVTIYDPSRPIPLTGSILRWDLLRDRIEWRDAGTVTAPR